jgi:tetratricopeptide (TPR) repeat protein
MPKARLTILVSVGLLLLTLLAYVQLWDNDFVNLDDPTGIFQNPDVLGGLTTRGAQWAWTTFHTGNWIPLTWLSLQLDASLSRLVQGSRSKVVPLAVIFHGQNLFWHCATVVLLFVVLRRMTGAVWRSALVAALFAVHPLHVESVAWAIERKDVLSTFFLVLTLLAYDGYVQRPGVGRYLLVVVCFVLGLLAKPMLVTLPCVLLLLDWWPLRRFSLGQLKRPLLEKVPLFVLSGAGCVMALLAQRHVAAMASIDTISLSSRLANAVVSYGWYLEKTFWPTGLAVFYCHPLNDWTWQPVLIAGAVLLGITILALATARRWPWLLLGWLWFVGTLVPVIGLVQVGEQARADRYVYVPHIGLFVAIVWSAAALGDRLRLPTSVRASLASACLLGLTVVTWAQVGSWHSSWALWMRALAAVPKNHRAYFEIGQFYFQTGNGKGDPEMFDQARRYFEQALALQPNNANYHAWLCPVLLRQGHLEKAARHLEQVIQLVPKPDRAWHTLGSIQRQQGKYEEAVQSLRQELEYAPRAADTHAELGLALWQFHRRSDAIREWEVALRINPVALESLPVNPNDAELLNGLGLALLHQGQNELAVLRFTAAVKAREQLIEAWTNLGTAYERLQQWEQANQCQAMAVKLKTQQPE